MGYMHIDNLYKNQEVLKHNPLWISEKIHGTSAHIRWDGTELHFHHGGANRESFLKIFPDNLADRFKRHGYTDIIIFGKAYGGKLQGMSDVYGKELRFIAFDVKINDVWQDVPVAKDIVEALGLEFVPTKMVSNDIAVLNAERDAGSTVAEWRGIGRGLRREGIVIKPYYETRDERGNRVIAKHKQAWATERKSPKEVDPNKAEVMHNAQAIADEWVVDMRMNHVLDKLGNPTEMSAIPDVIRAMIEDVMREAEGEIEDTKEIRKAIGNAAMRMFKARIMKVCVE